MNALFNKYKDIILYGIFGVLTTVVNIVVYWLCSHALHMPVMVATVIAWVVAVLFAYVTNRTWVFHSEAHTPKEIKKEIISFVSCRLATGAVDWACMWVFVDLMHRNDMVVKVVANVLVIILNFILSKLVIFKHKGA